MKELEEIGLSWECGQGPDKKRRIVATCPSMPGMKRIEW
jgi:hypothetical protein